MLGPSHLLFGAVSYTAYATLYTHQPLAQVALGAVVATAVSDGVLSPDMDQRAPFGWARTVLGPAGRLLAHRRGVTHWWALPVAAWLWWLPVLDSSTRWAATALVIGWASHIAGDAVFGRVPVTPGWGKMIGLGLKTGGWVESGGGWVPISPLRAALTLALAGLVWVSVTA